MKSLASAIAACPACRTPLLWPDAPRAECPACGRVYAMAEGAAWLQLDAAGDPVTPPPPQPLPPHNALRRAWSKAPQ